jgi:transcriptional regulator with XRE-family HTH domain
MIRVCPEPFGDYVRRIRTAKRLSCADVERRSARFGKPIAGSYVNRIENDPRLNPSVDRLKALAYGLDVPVDEVLAQAIQIAPLKKSPDELRLLARFRELSQQRRMDVLMITDLWYSKRTT